MDIISGIVQYLADYLSGLLHFPIIEMVGALVVLINGLIAVCLLIPGEQPEKFLQSVVDFISKLSLKPKP